MLLATQSLRATKPAGILMMRMNEEASLLYWAHNEARRSSQYDKHCRVNRKLARMEWLLPRKCKTKLKSKINNQGDRVYAWMQEQHTADFTKNIIVVHVLLSFFRSWIVCYVVFCGNRDNKPLSGNFLSTALYQTGTESPPNLRIAGERSPLRAVSEQPRYTTA
jgi:hypothetical protein